MKNEYRFYMQISREEYLQHYAGEASFIQFRSEDGKRIQFPASAIKPLITHQGINGYFLIKFDKNHKLVELKKFNYNCMYSNNFIIDA